jgi:uncharacterized protein (TIGR02246 family)
LHPLRKENAMSGESGSTRSTSARSPDRSEDLGLFRHVVTALARTKRTRDPDGFMRPLVADAVWMNAFARTLTGWDVIRAFTHNVLTPALADEHATYEVAHVTFLGDVVGAVNVKQTPVGTNGARDATRPEGLPLYVMKRDKGACLIALAQNTQVQRETITAQSRAIGGRE